MAYVHDNEDREFTSPPEVDVSGTGSAGWALLYEKPKRVKKKQPLGFAPPSSRAKKR